MEHFLVVDMIRNISHILYILNIQLGLFIVLGQIMVQLDGQILPIIWDLDVIHLLGLFLLSHLGEVGFGFIGWIFLQMVVIPSYIIEILLMQEGVGQVIGIILGLAI